MFPLFSRPSRRVACAVLLAAPLPLWAADEATEMLTRYRSQVTSQLLDHHGVLDADYDQALREGRTLDVLLGDREQVRYPGRYLVVVDSGRTGRPDWSPAPFLPHRRPTTPAPG
jgi:hypothetical protein